MDSERTRVYELEGLRLEIPLHYDQERGQWFELLPDLEEQPRYSSQGKPVVCAVQDICARKRQTFGEPCRDCGSCAYYEATEPHDLIGLCGDPTRRQPSEVRLE